MKLEEVFKKIAAITERSGVSKSELARRAGTTQPNISHILAGHRKLVTLDMIIRILDGLGYEIEIKPKYKYE